MIIVQSKRQCPGNQQGRGHGDGQEKGGQNRSV